MKQQGAGTPPWLFYEPGPLMGLQAAGTHQGRARLVQAGRMATSPGAPEERVVLTSLARGTIGGSVPRTRKT